MLIVFDDMIEDTESSKKLSPIVTKFFLRGKQLNILLVFIPQSYFEVPKTIRTNTLHFKYLKISNKRKAQQIASKHSSDMSLKTS